MKRNLFYLVTIILVVTIDFSILYSNYGEEYTNDDVVRFPRVPLKEKEEVEEIEIDEDIDRNIDDKIYNSLNISSLFVSNIKNEETDKIKWYYNISDRTYYLFLPKVIDRKNIKIEFTLKNNINTYLSIYQNDNLIKKIVSKETLPLEEEEYNFVLETNVKKPTSYHVKVKQSNLPSLFINIDGGDASFRKIKSDYSHNTYFPGVATIADVDNEIYDAEVTKFKGRGNATWRRNKKPFAIKFNEKVSLFGMKKAKNYNLLANYYDGSLSRNYLWLNFAKDIGLDYASECETIDLYVNNNYQGTYLITSKVEAKSNRVDINDNEFLFEFDYHYGKANFRTSHGYPTKIHNPDLEGLSYQERNSIFSSAKSYLNHIESLIYNSNTSYEELSKYIDLESFAKYYWVNEISLNYDASRNSVYSYVKDGKYYAGPIWDMDATLNRSYVYTKTTGYYTLDDNSLNGGRTGVNYFRPLLKRDDFSLLTDEIYFKYYDLINDLPNKLEEYYKYIDSSAEMNYIRWPYNKMKANQWDVRWRTGDNDFTSSKNYFLNDLKKRIEWYNNEYANLKYENLVYKVYNEDKIVKSGEIKENLTSLIPKNSTKIEIYGIIDNQEKLLKEIVMESDTYQNDLILQNRTSSNYKRYNSYKYELSFIKI